MGSSQKPLMSPAELCMELNNETILDIQFESYAAAGWMYSGFFHVLFMGERIARISYDFWSTKPDWTFTPTPGYNGAPLKHYNSRVKGLTTKLLNEIEPLIEEAFIEKADKHRGKLLAQKVLDELVRLVDREVEITSRTLIGASAQTTYSPLIKLRATNKGRGRLLYYGDYRRKVKAGDVKKLRKTINFINRHTKAIRKHFEETNNE